MRSKRKIGPSTVTFLGSGRGISERVICETCRTADSPLGRLKGLLGRGQLSHGEGLLLQPASAIHTCFMRFPIDVVFLDRGLRVVGVAEKLKPWRTAARRGARAALELRAGECERHGIRAGDILRIENGR